MDALCTNNDELASRLRAMAQRGESAYADVDGESVHDVPSTAIRGRAGTCGKTFAGALDLTRGAIRIDCAEEPSFWLEIDLSAMPHFAAGPSGAKWSTDIIATMRSYS